ncbi:MAG: hypothetical protein JWN96_747, partial [Mycobacterium sp.]|nr:hypothetical protein [Mycobacterium sp.]
MNIKTALWRLNAISRSLHTFARTSANDTSRVLEQLDELLIASPDPVTELLSPGLSEHAIQDAFSAIGVRPHDDVVTWFSWHNGTKDDGPRPLAGANLYFCSLEQMKDAYRSTLQLAIEFGPEYGGSDKLWHPALFPIAQTLDNGVVGVWGPDVPTSGQIARWA